MPTLISRFYEIYIKSSSLCAHGYEGLSLKINEAALQESCRRAVGRCVID